MLDRSGKATTNLAPTRTITYAAVPPKPVTTYKVVSQKWNSSGSNYVEVDKITWVAPAGYAAASLKSRRRPSRSAATSSW